MKCGTCEFWKPSEYNKHFLPSDFIGECGGLLRKNNVDIEINAGWDGGYVSRIETGIDFFCANYKEKI
jgi:hypothetical protein